MASHCYLFAPAPSYNRLLKSHPNGVGLARCYSMFCDDVLNDTTQANEYRVSTSTSDGNSTSGGSKAGGQSILSNAQRSMYEPRSLHVLRGTDMAHGVCRVWVMWVQCFWRPYHAHIGAAPTYS